MGVEEQKLTQEIYSQVSEEFSLEKLPQASGSIGVECITLEEADGGRGLKGVFVAKRLLHGQEQSATFETGSFLDQSAADNTIEKHDVCISTAGGCTRGCTFCSVPIADLGFERLLTPEEIVFQAAYMIALRNPASNLPNVVGLMGNGEPADNKAIIPAVDVLASRDDIKSITVSSIGENIKGIHKLQELAVRLDKPVKLQLSLHAADPSKRRTLIPGRTSVESVVKAADGYAEATGLAVKFNVVLMEVIEKPELDGFTNASIEDARKLAALLLAPSYASGKQITRRLKLSAYNNVPGTPYSSPSEEIRQEFVETLRAEGIEEIKTFRGSGINIDQKQGLGGFACGQLRATTSMALKNHEKK